MGDALRRLAVGALAATVLAPALAGCGGGSGSAGLNGMTTAEPMEVGDVSMTAVRPDGRGHDASFRATPDGLQLVFFGFTSCEDVCPTTLGDLRAAVAGLSPGQAKRVKVGMVTVDPARDSAKALNDYLGGFFDAGSYIAYRTDDPARLADVEDAFGATSRLGKPDRNGDYEVTHTALVYAVDDQGKVVDEWGYGTGSSAIGSDLATLLG